MLITLKKFAYACSPTAVHPFLKRIEASDVGLRLARGVFWSLAGSAISRGLMLCASIVVARILGKTGYGELGMIQSTLGMFGVFAGFGLGLTATKYVAEFRRSDPMRAGRIIRLSGRFAALTGGLMALCLLIFAPWLAVKTINAPHLAGILRIGALILFINALNGAQTGALSGFEAFKTIARINLFIGIISFPMLVSGAWFGRLTGAVWALAINLGFNLLINHMALLKEARRYNVPLTLDNCTVEWGVLLKFSFPAAIGGAMVGLLNWVSNAMLVNRPNGYGEMGIYNVANQWRLAILFIPAMLSQVILPLLSNLLGESKTDMYRRFLLLNISLNFSIAAAIVLPLILFAEHIMIAYGSGFGSGAQVLRILSVSAVLIAINNIVGQAIASKGQMWIGFFFNFLWAVTLLSTAFVLIQRGYGALGLAYANLIAYILHTFLQGLYIYRSLRTIGV